MQTANAALDIISIRRIKPSKTNPRKNFDKTAHEELTESVKKHGVLQPILVRPNGDLFEIVAGERRYRAAVAAKLKEVPVNIRDLSDEEMMEIQVIENLQRQDLHPLEEAEGYEALMRKYDYKTAEEIAAKIGKSKSYVYGRLKLCELTLENRKAFYDERLTPSTALLLARMPAELQNKASKMILEGKYGEGPMSYRAAQEYLNANFTLSLEGAPFDTAAAHVIPNVGPCTTCPKRTGNQKDLFPDIKSADVCTDPACFKAKKEASWKSSVSADKEKGHAVLSASKSDSMFCGRELVDSYHYVKLQASCDHDSKGRTWLQLLKDVLKPEDILVAAYKDGTPCRLLLKSRAEQLLLDAGHKFAEKKVERKLSPEQEAKQKLERFISAESLLECVSQAIRIIEKKNTLMMPALRIIAEHILDQAENEDCYEFFHRRQIDGEKARKKALASMSEQELIGLMFEAVVFMGNGYGYSSPIQDDTPAFKAMVTMSKITPGEIKKKMRERIELARKNGEPVLGICSKCGCTEIDGCAGGCSWTDKEKTVCSKCAPAPTKKKGNG